MNEGKKAIMTFFILLVIALVAIIRLMVLGTTQLDFIHYARAYHRNVDDCVRKNLPVEDQIDFHQDLISYDHRLYRHICPTIEMKEMYERMILSFDQNQSMLYLQIWKWTPRQLSGDPVLYDAVKAFKVKEVVREKEIRDALAKKEAKRNAYIMSKPLPTCE